LKAAELAQVMQKESPEIVRAQLAAICGPANDATAGKSVDGGGAAGAGEEWLSVTEAAELLRRDLPGLDLKKARSRVSTAANRGKFKTNGGTGKGRKIHRDSFSRWRLEQRDTDLDAQDEQGP